MLKILCIIKGELFTSCICSKVIHMSSAAKKASIKVNSSVNSARNKYYALLKNKATLIEESFGLLK